jgi:phosphoenolpyruvate synthase/pyruvate phosphate dikinase
MKNLLGGKGANPAEMSNLGLPVPPGFTITTEVCTYYYDHNRSYPQELKTQVENAPSAAPRAAPSAMPRTRFSSPLPSPGGEHERGRSSTRTGRRAQIGGLLGQHLGLEAAHLAGGGGLLSHRPATNHPAHRRIVR